MERLGKTAGSLCTTCNSHLSARYDKVVAGLLVLFLVTLSLVDLAVDWLNYVDLGDPNLRYGLAVGAPRQSSLRALLFFNAIGCVTFTLELVNTLTLISNGGHMKIEVEVEQIIVLLFEEIPLAAVNLRVMLCRGDFLTARQTLAGLTGMLTCVCRLYVYGWVKERRFRYERTTIRWILKIVAYVSASTLVFIFFIIQCFTLNRAAASHGLGSNRLWQQDNLQSQGLRGESTGVSVFLLSPASLATVERVTQQQMLTNYSLNTVVVRQSLAWDEPWLVRDIGDIIRAGKGGLTTYCQCDLFALESPAECAEATRLIVKFVYLPSSQDTSVPYGQFRYNVAKGSSRRRILGNGSSQLTVTDRCQEMDSQLADGWRPLLLSAYVTPSGNEQGQGTRDVWVRRPWPNCCQQIDIRYDASLPVCWHAQADEVHSLSRRARPDRNRK